MLPMMSFTFCLKNFTRDVDISVGARLINRKKWLFQHYKLNYPKKFYQKVVILSNWANAKAYAPADIAWLAPCFDIVMPIRFISSYAISVEEPRIFKVCFDRDCWHWRDMLWEMWYIYILSLLRIQDSYLQHRVWLLKILNLQTLWTGALLD